MLMSTGGAVSQLRLVSEKLIIDLSSVAYSSSMYQVTLVEVILVPFIS